MNTRSAGYTTGSVFRHVSSLSVTSAIGLLAIFAVDLVDVFFIALLGEPELAAAVGFAGTALFFGAAIGIGLSIAASTLVAQAIGADRPDDAGRLASHGLISGLLLTVPLTMYCLIDAERLIALLGAEGHTLQLATRYFRIVVAATPILGIGMACSSLLRAVGEARLSMWATILGGLVNAILDPILIFGLNLDLTGAASASVVSRCTVAFMAVYFLQRRHQLLRPPSLAAFPGDVRQLSGIAIPSLITNLAAPLGAAYATSRMAQFGTDAVAAASVVGRITPVAFAGLYGLSGAIGPVASQNVGAARPERVTRTLRSGGLFVSVYVLPVALLLYLLKDTLVALFSLDGEAAELLRFYCTWIVISYWLYGLQLAANPLFTALRHPGYATISNIVRDLCLGIPLVHLGSTIYGAPGVLGGQALGNMLAGVLAYATALWLARHNEAGLSIGLPFAFLRRRWHYYRALAPGVQHRG